MLFPRVVLRVKWDGTTDNSGIQQATNTFHVDFSTSFTGEETKVYRGGVYSTLSSVVQTKITPSLSSSLISFFSCSLPHSLTPSLPFSLFSSSILLSLWQSSKIILCVMGSFLSVYIFAKHVFHKCIFICYKVWVYVYVCKYMLIFPIFCPEYFLYD